MQREVTLERNGISIEFSKIRNCVRERNGNSAILVVHLNNILQKYNTSYQIHNSQKVTDLVL